MELTTNQLTSMLRQRATSKKKGSAEAKKQLTRYMPLLIMNELNFDVRCPKKHSKKNYVKNGGGRYYCKKCKKTFRPTSNTILEGYSFTSDEWKTIIEMVFDNVKLKRYKTKLKSKKFSYEKAHTLRIKVLSAIANVPQPKLSGIVQIDGTYFRESQKGSKDLESYVYKCKNRASRRNYHYASMCGILGEEFYCVISGVDSNGNTFAECTGVGQPSFEELETCLNNHLEDKPIFICSDKYEDYDAYCVKYNINHHVTPSTYQRQLKLAGYVRWGDRYRIDPITEEEQKMNEKIVKMLYNEGIGPHIVSDKKISYSDYISTLEKFGKEKFGLNKVNAFHSKVKGNYASVWKNVSSHYVKLYVALQVYKDNFVNKYGHECLDEDEDYDIVFKDIFNYYDKTKYQELQKDNCIAKPTYDRNKNNRAEKKTKEIRVNFKTSKGEFEGKELENTNIFNKRQCFRDMPIHRLRFLSSYFKLGTNYVNQIADTLAKRDDADKIIFREIYLSYYASDEELFEARGEGYLPRIEVSCGRPKKDLQTLWDFERYNAWRKKRKIILDCETTGLLDDEKSEIISLSIIDEDGKVLFDKRFKPVRKKKFTFASRINHLTWNDLKNENTFESYLREIQRIVDNTDMIVGYNLDKFDIEMLKRQGITIQKETFDVMTMWNKVHSRGYKKLEKLALHKGYKPESDFHTSLEDTKATLFLLKKLMPK